MPDNLYEEFLGIIGRGDEKVARDFWVTHLKEFSQETQDAIVMAFFEEAVAKKAEDAQLIAGIQKQGLEIADFLEKEKSKLQDKAKLLELKENI